MGQSGFLNLALRPPFSTTGGSAKGLSVIAEASVLPSGENARALTSSLRTISRTSLPVRVSHRQMDALERLSGLGMPTSTPLPKPTATILLSGENAAALGTPRIGPLPC